MGKKNVSSVYKYEGKMFRYDFESCIVEYICKADKEMLKDEAEWIAKYGRGLYDIDADGYIVIDSAGLRTENWKNKEVRNEYLAEWISEIEYECRLMAKEFML